MKNKILILTLFLISINVVLAEYIPYYSVKKSAGGIVIGVELFDSKTKKALKPTGLFYEWTFPNISLNPERTNINVLLAPLTSFPQFLLLDLKVSKPLATTSLFSAKKQKIFLAKTEPRAKIVRRTSKGMLLPLVDKLEEDDTLIVITKNFSSKTLNYVWELDDLYFSNEKEIPVKNLKKKSGIIKVRVFGIEAKERADDWQKFQIK
jgi:hypothetical protein